MIWPFSCQQKRVSTQSNVWDGVFCQKVNGWKPRTFFIKSSILVAWLGLNTHLTYLLTFFFFRTFGQLSLVSLGAALIYAWQRKITKGKQLTHQQNHFPCNCVAVFITLPKVVYIKYFSLKHYFKSQSFVVTALMQIIYF